MVSGMIADSTIHAEIKLDSDATVMNTYHAIFKAGQEIELLGGFEIELGAELDLMIENCNNN